MKHKPVMFFVLMNLVSSVICGDRAGKGVLTPELQNQSGIVNNLEAVLTQLSQDSGNPFFQDHCASILRVIHAKSPLTQADSSLMETLYVTLTQDTSYWNIGAFSSYLARKRPLIFSWTSPTDGSVSLAWLLLPENWNPEETYPLYVRLHGLWYVYDNPIECMTWYLGSGLAMETTFEDGYSFFPWARGNLWYRNIAEIDVREGLDSLESYVHIDPARKYLTGFSMGGYGAWYLGQKSPESWAAIGIYAGALWYGGNMLNSSVAGQLKDIPVYFVCGDRDGLLRDNQTAYGLLQDAGNENLFFTTFPGGHESQLANWQGMYEWIRQFSKESSGANDAQTPVQYGLVRNYPNPFNSGTRIEVTVPFTGHTELAVYNILQQKVRTLFSSVRTAGTYETVWDGLDDSGNDLPGGTYMCRLSVNGQRLSHKMLLVK